ncbi:HAD-IA family hydrolase [Streptomyces sp. NPDC046465]|uniref:HAD-IA family hydrolase n=1 Tax=Streptomyces sp. NPDC046465 TaxID=3155810 RepID=UPI0033E6BEAA
MTTSPNQPLDTAATATLTPVRHAVVFDLDGVIVDSLAVMNEAFTHAYAEVVGDGPAPFEEYQRHQGRYFTDIMQIMGLPLEMEEPFVRESYRLAGQVRVFDGIPELLTTLRERGLRLAIATGKAGDRARSLLDVLGLLPHFDHVIGSDEIPHPKPAPDIVRHALALLDVPADRAIMVGDAPTDMASARGAGVATAAAVWATIDREELLACGPDVVLHGPADLLAVCPAVHTR